MMQNGSCSIVDQRFLYEKEFEEGANPIEGMGQGLPSCFNILRFFSHMTELGLLAENFLALRDLISSCQ